MIEVLSNGYARLVGGREAGRTPEGWFVVQAELSQTKQVLIVRESISLDAFRGFLFDSCRRTGTVVPCIGEPPETREELEIVVKEWGMWAGLEVPFRSAYLKVSKEVLSNKKALFEVLLKSEFAKRNWFV